jgi:hypothetical protein
LVRSLPASSDCNQYCNEVVDQVMQGVALYGNDTLIGQDGLKEKLNKDKIWSQTCADSCLQTFELRATAGFEDGKKNCG